MSKRIPSLDGLRGVAIAFVLLCHAVQATHPHPTGFSRYLEGLGNFGVQIFFVLSGFLITTLLLLERARSGSINLRNFFRRRAYRILPASLVYTTLAIGGTILLHGELHWNQIGAVYLFSAGYMPHLPWQLGHLWSLGVEEQFYFLWPIMLLIWFRGRVAIAFCLVLTSFFYRSHGTYDLLYSFPAVADSMAIGALLAIMTPWLKRGPEWFWSLPVRGALILLTMTCPPLLHTRNAAYWGIEPLLIALAMFALVQRPDDLLNSRPLKYLGAVSYSLYLAQQPFLNPRSSLGLVWLPFRILAAFGAGLLLHYGIEKPFLAIGHRRRHGLSMPADQTE